MKINASTYQSNRFEVFIIIAFWGLLFASPLAFGRFDNGIEWERITTSWLNFLPLLMVFLINRFILVPYFFFKEKKIIYVVSTLLIIAGFTFGILQFNGPSPQRLPPSNEQFQGERRQPPPDRQFQGERREPPPNQKRNSPQPIPNFANFLILAVLLVGFDTGLQLSMRWSSLEKEKLALQNENTESQLAFLKNQVSPHFFMNTLNNIHALVDIDSDEAKNAIIKLSNLMRHLLYDSGTNNTPIKKEIGFIESYVELMRLRFSEKVSITVEIPGEIPDKTIPPLLFTSLLENAFKHGISYNAISFVAIAISFEKNNLNFSIKNSNHQQIQDSASSGIGIENTKKRLDLIYKNTYQLVVNSTESTYSVHLTIPL